MPTKVSTPSIGLAGAINLREAELDVKFASGVEALSLSGPIGAPVLKEIRSIPLPKGN